MKRIIIASAVALTLILCACAVQPDTPTSAVTKTARLTKTSTPTLTVQPSATKLLASTAESSATFGPRLTYDNNLPTATPTLTSTPETMSLPTASLNGDQATSVQRDCRYVIDQMHAYKLLEDFKPNMYFSFMKHIRMQEGYVLDYVYYSDGMGGLPVVYARKESDPPFNSYDEFLASYGEESGDERSYNLSMPHGSDYLEKIVVDGTAESYFEFLTLAWLGDQFKLEWHGMYNDYKFMCDYSDMKYVYDSMSIFDYGEEKFLLPADVEFNAQFIDYTPRVSVNAENVLIRLVMFTKWGGFNELYYTVGRDDPMDVQDSQINSILEYDCGIAF
jgi:hypothetical protein